MADTVSRLAIQVGMDTQQLRSGAAGVSSVMGDLASRFRLAVDPIQLAGQALSVTSQAAKDAAVAYVGLGMATQDIVAQLKQVSRTAEELQTLKGITFDFGGGFFDDQDISNTVTALRRAGADLNEIGPSLEVIGKLAAGTGNSLDDMAAKLRKIASDGVVSFKDLKSLELDAIPITSQLAREFGTTEEAIRKLAAEGKISLAQLGESLENLTGKGGQFFDSIEAQNDTLRGQIRGLKDDLEDLFRPDAEGFADSLKESIAALRENSGRQSFFENLRDNPFSPLALSFFAKEMAKVNKEAAAFGQLADSFQKVLNPPNGAFSDAFSKLADKAKEDLDETADAMKKAGERLRDSLLTPQEQFNRKLTEANELLINGAISSDTYARAVEAAKAALDKQTESAVKLRTELGRINATPGLVRGTAGAATAIANNAQAQMRGVESRLDKIAELLRTAPVIKGAKL